MERVIFYPHTELITVSFDKPILSDLQAIEEAIKVLQREYIRKTNNDKPTTYRPDF